MSVQYAIPATTFVLKSVIERALGRVYGPAQPPPPVSIAPHAQRRRARQR